MYENPKKVFLRCQRQGCGADDSQGQSLGFMLLQGDVGNDRGGVGQ